MQCPLTKTGVANKETTTTTGGEAETTAAIVPSQLNPLQPGEQSHW